MAAASNSNSTPVYTPSAPLPSSDELAVKAVNKRFEGLMTVRTKAVKGKGAWYWAYLEPILIRSPETNLPKAVKLKCSLCDSAFSASNPSRTATEHLKRGTCPNFSSLLTPISSVSPITSIASPSSHKHRKRTAKFSISSSSPTQTQIQPLTMIDSSRVSFELGHSAQIGTRLNPHHHLGLSGGKEDLGALAMLEDSVKKLKSPKNSPGPTLNKDQIESALAFLADWFYESCGSVSFSSLDHPKFKSFLHQVGLPSVSRREFSGSRLDLKFHEAKIESEARIREALFFQVASDGWNGKNCNYGEENLIKFMVNLPNGTSVFQKAIFSAGLVPSKYAEEILWETIEGVSGNSLRRCVSIVADKYKAKALRNLETQNPWMVNLSCQFQGVLSLIKDFNQEFPLFTTVTEKCFKVANYFNCKSVFRSNLQKFRSQEVELVGLLRVPSPKCIDAKDFSHVFPMLEDVLSCSRMLQVAVLEDQYKSVCLEDPIAREVAETIQDMRFWNELEAVYSLVKLVRGMADEIEVERPLVAQCLPLWEDLRTKAKDWCAKFNIPEHPIQKIIEKRFKKNYHPAWSAAFILDPQYLMRDVSGKYLPPFKFLTNEQEKDVDKLITRLVPKEEAHIALMELMKWRSEGLEPLYAQAVQVKQRDPATGKMRIANPQSSRLVWETCLKEFNSLGKVAIRLLFLHATSCGFKCNWSFMRWMCIHGQSSLGLDRAQKMIFIAAHAKLERRDISNEEEKDAELFSMSSGDDEMLHEVFADAPSVMGPAVDLSIPKLKKMEFSRLIS